MTADQTETEEAKEPRNKIPQCLAWFFVNDDWKKNEHRPLVPWRGIKLLVIFQLLILAWCAAALLLPNMPELFCLLGRTAFAHAYVTLPILLFLVISYTELCLVYKPRVHRMRLVDQSKVMNWISGEMTLFARRYDLAGDETTNSEENGDEKNGCEKNPWDTELPAHYNKLQCELKTEIKKLKDVGKEFWTEYRILTAQQLWVEFYRVDELKAEAQSVLEDLEDYADNPKVPYDAKQYQRWKDKIETEIRKLEFEEERGTSELDIDHAAARLRAYLVTLYDHVADYQFTWAKGTILLQLLLLGASVTLLALVFSGLLGLWYPKSHGYLGVVNWMLLAPAGALAAVLRNLWRADRLEVGHEEGSRELWRAVIAVPLGAVAGLVAYALVASGVIGHRLAPCIPSAITSCRPDLYLSDVSLSILWALGAGYVFEYIYDRLRGALA